MAVILQVPTNTTVLPNPNPEFSDVEQALSTITLKRSKTQKRYTYVKTRQRKRLVWNFQLTREKAWELRAFVEAYRNDVITITDFDNDMWRGVIKSNPINFTSSSRDALCREAVDVTLEFEVIRLSPTVFALSGIDDAAITEEAGRQSDSQDSSSLSEDALCFLEALFDEDGIALLDEDDEELLPEGGSHLLYFALDNGDTFELTNGDKFVIGVE
jgi:hypothetical protein